MTKKELQEIIQEEYANVRLEEGVLSWASGAADNLVYGILNRRADIMHSKIFDDPKLLKLAKDLKMDKRDFEKRVTSMLSRDNRFLKNLATVRAKYV
tara:strand:+ start:747 stop:1037 length:291 start_codon:yes stop_codon:yes gene_type:complete